jgi:hypothetical protein
LPHSNFHPSLKIASGGTVIEVSGPMEPVEPDVVSIVVTGFVTQPPAERDSAEAQQGPTATHNVTLGHAELALSDNTWMFSADVLGGTMREGWAFASADLTEKSSDGAIERYTWSQWVWLHP